MLHDELRRAREAAGMTQAELAKKAGIPRNQVVRAEKGQNITLDTLRKIAVYLPITELPLLDRVKLTTDILPIHDKVYLGALETLDGLMAAVGVAVRHAQDTLDAYTDTRKQETPDEKAQRGAEIDPSLLLNRIEQTLKQVEQSRRSA